MKWIKKIVLFILLLPVLYMLQVSLRQHHQPEVVETPQGFYNKDLYQQLRFLKGKMHEGAGRDMQKIYPEGFLFIHALYALSWANLVEKTTAEFLRAEALQEIRWSIAQMESDKAKAIFPADMFLSYGVFYQGWVNYTRARYLGLQPENARDTIQFQRFQQACEQIAAAIERHHTPFLPSYHGGCWPADNVLALAALHEHDRLTIPRFESVCETWLAGMKSKVDTNGLIPHMAKAVDGSAARTARGSSQSLMLAFWPRVDSVFALQQFEIYEELFLDKRLGLPGVREHPKGIQGRGDIDAGPVIWDIGGAASVVGMGSTAQYGASETYTGLRNSIEGFGMAVSWREEKCYLLGALPMADAFIAWSHSRTPKLLLSASPSGSLLIWGMTLALIVLWMLCFRFS